MDKVQLQNRTKNFALRIFKMVEKLPKSKGVEVIIYQLLENLLKEANELVAIFTAAIRLPKINRKL